MFIWRPWSFSSPGSVHPCSFLLSLAGRLCLAGGCLCRFRHWRGGFSFSVPPPGCNGFATGEFWYLFFLFFDPSPEFPFEVAIALSRFPASRASFFCLLCSGRARARHSFRNLWLSVLLFLPAHALRRCLPRLRRRLSFLHSPSSARGARLLAFSPPASFIAGRGLHSAGVGRVYPHSL